MYFTLLLPYPGAPVACNLFALNPNLAGLVPHVMVFIVPRQIVPLGDPARRSCDACESFGASVKKIIRHMTCRRRVMQGKSYSHKRGDKLWSSTFSRGYVEQAFRRVCVRAELQHGKENLPYLQRADFRLVETGKVAGPKAERDAAPEIRIADAVDAPTAWSYEAAMAVWPC